MNDSPDPHRGPSHTRAEHDPAIEFAVYFTDDNPGYLTDGRQPTAFCSRSDAVAATHGWPKLRTFEIHERLNYTVTPWRKIAAPGTETTLNPAELRGQLTTMRQELARIDVVRRGAQDQAPLGTLADVFAALARAVGAVAAVVELLAREHGIDPYEPGSPT